MSILSLKSSFSFHFMCDALLYSKFRLLFSSSMYNGDAFLWFYSCKFSFPARLRVTAE